MKLEVKKDGKVIEVIDRKPTAKMIGNFNPHFVRYHNKQHLVKGGVDYAYMHGEHPLGVEYFIEV